MRLLRNRIARAVLLAALAVHGVAQAAAPAAPAERSFAELYRLTVGAEYVPGAARVPAPLPVPVSFSVAPAPGATPWFFSIGAVPPPGRGLLLLSGLAAAAWVARRRLGYSL